MTTKHQRSSQPRSPQTNASDGPTTTGRIGMLVPIRTWARCLRILVPAAGAVTERCALGGLLVAHSAHREPLMIERLIPAHAHAIGLSS